MNLYNLWCLEINMEFLAWGARGLGNVCRRLTPIHFYVTKCSLFLNVDAIKSETDIGSSHIVRKSRRAPAKEHSRCADEENEFILHLPEAQTNTTSYYQWPDRRTNNNNSSNFMRVWASESVSFFGALNCVCSRASSVFVRSMSKVKTGWNEILCCCCQLRASP